MKILVYTMGKVGSTTVMRALESVGFAAGRAYPGNIATLNLDDYDGFITMVREPIARNISQFFETRAEFIRSAVDPIHLFKISFPHTFPLNWFNEHIKPILGINVMRKSFPKTQGWAIYDNLLVIKTERLNEALAEALCEFLVPHDYKVEHRAIGVEKFHPSVGAKYEHFMKTAKFSEEFLNSLYDSKYMKKFYLKTEIDAFRERWAE